MSAFESPALSPPAGLRYGTRMVTCVPALLSLETDPVPPGCKKLKNRDGWRVRVGDYRILYFADKAAHEVPVGVIAHRREVYRR